MASVRVLIRELYEHDREFSLHLANEQEVLYVQKILDRPGGFNLPFQFFGSH